MPKADEIANAATALREQILDIESKIMVPDLRDGWADGINAGARLFDKLVNLPSAVQLGDYPPTDAAAAAFAEVKSDVDQQIKAFEKLVKKDLAKLNDQISAAKIGAVAIG
jgi:hypothetical protein